MKKVVILAALLHDIGKFFQRADTGEASTSTYLKPDVIEFTRKNLDVQNIQSYSEVYWTVQFLFNHQKCFQLVFNEQQWNQFITLIVAYHSPQTEEQHILNQADQYANGLARNKKPIETIGKKNKISEARLTSIFSQLFKNIQPSQWKYDLQTLDAQNLNFPKNKFNESLNYSSLWKSFSEEYSLLSFPDFEVAIENTLSLLKKYTTYIPSSEQHLPDVALYDHLKSTACFAGALYDINSNEIKEKEFLFIGADLSGIQQFIYGGLSKYAAKNLKGRSYYLQLILESTWQEIINSLNLNSTNLVYNSGGKFYLIAPKLSTSEEQLNALEKKISSTLNQSTEGQLSVNIASVSFECDSLLEQKKESISKLWLQLAEGINTKKRQRFTTLIENDYAQFFEPSGKGGEFEFDRVTGTEFLANEQPKKLDTGHFNESINVKKSTHETIELGKIMREAIYCLIASKKQEHLSKVFHIMPAGLEHHFYFFTPKNVHDLKHTKTVGKLISINQTDGIINTYLAQKTVFFGGNQIPINKNNDVKTFEELVDAENSSSGFNKLAILRMDVDNLGYIFTKGLNQELKTFSRYSTLSKQFDLFFSGYINTLIQKEKYADHLFIIYSGGDDLCAVGQWSKLIDFAIELRHDFIRFVGHHPQISLSGGISLISPKYPILKAANLAGEAEEKAKHHHLGQLEKNALCLFDKALNFDLELPIVLNLKKELAQLLDKKIIHKNFIHRLINYQFKANIINGKLTNFKVLWLIAYDFKRLKEECKSDKEQFKQFTEELKNKIATNSIAKQIDGAPYHSLQYIALAARWVEFETRLL